MLSHTLAALRVVFTWLLFHVKNVDPRMGVLAAMRQVLAALLGQLRFVQAMLCTYVVGRGARGGGLAPLAHPGLPNVEFRVSRASKRQV